MDSQGAFNIVRLLRKLCDSGHAILCTLHQPSAVLFGYFDDLLLLQTGGNTVYFGPVGPKGETLIDYFERNGAVKCKKEANPAEYGLLFEANNRYMLEAIGAGGVTKTNQDWSQVWRTSDERKRVLDEIRSICGTETQAVVWSDEKEYAMSLASQTIALTKRTFTSYWRDPNYLLGK